MYISANNTVQSFERLYVQKVEPAFWALMFILKYAKEDAANQILQTDYLLRFDGGKVSERLIKLFSFQEKQQPSDYMKLALSETYIDGALNKFLKGNKINLQDAICLLMHDQDFDETNDEFLKEKFIKYFLLSDDELTAWFYEDGLFSIDFVEDYPKDYKRLFEMTDSSKTIVTNGNRYQVAEAGEWGRSGYLQIFSITGKSREFMQVIRDDLMPRFLSTSKPISLVASKRAKNQIIFGAPGVGKSHRANEIVKDGQFVRTVFHPATTSSDFIGSMVPSITVDAQGIKHATYEYQPGAFLKALSVAEKCIEHQTQAFLVIEELNRAPAESVFADIFQLLDRNESGASSFPVSLDINATEYVREFAPSSLLEDGIIIPPNLSLIATMNYSDQNVFNLDNAFKRRWELEFVPIDFSDCPRFFFEFNDLNDKPKSISWQKLGQTINSVLEMNGYQEDQKIGQYFISYKEAQIFGKKIIVDKLFSYLWEEVLDISSRTLFFNASIKSFQQLHSSAMSDEGIFSEAFLLQLLAGDN